MSSEWETQAIPCDLGEQSHVAKNDRRRSLTATGGNFLRQMANKELWVIHRFG